MQRRCWLASALLVCAHALDGAEAIRPVAGGIRLFDGTSLNGFSTWLVDTQREDPRGVFSVTNGLLRISGEGLGYLATRSSHRDYHLIAEYRWGQRNWAWGDRVGKARDSGIFLHSFGPDGNSHDGKGAFKAAIECNVFQGATGDFLLIRGHDEKGGLLAPSLTVETAPDADAEGWSTWQPGGASRAMRAWGRVNWRDKSSQWQDQTDFRGARDVESPGQEWTRLECICRGDTISILVNGTLVNRATRVFPDEGPILLQCEGSEIHFRRLELLPLTEDWPAWRGPRGDGTSLEAGVPLHWGEASNVVWQVPLSGTGHASPIVVGDRIFLAGAQRETGRRILTCLDRETGRDLWTREVIRSPLEGKHRLNSFASSTPACDGERVYTAFLDQSEMVVTAYDLEGRRVWQVRPGAFSSMHGFCSSPVLFENLVIVNGDHDGDSYLVALDRSTGQTVWKTPRPNKTRSYCVPTLFHLDGATQMVLSGDKSVAAYNPQDGSRLWYRDGPTEQFVASVVYNRRADLLLVTGGYPDKHILALRHDGRGTLGEDQIVWRTTKGVSYVPSPIAVGAYFLVVSDGGFASCFGAKDGRLLWQERLGGGHSASLVTAEGRVYFLSDDGRMTVVRPGPTFEVLARNHLPDQFSASPAISRGRLYLRGETTLYCIWDAQEDRATEE